MLPITALVPEDAARCPIRGVLSRVTGKWQVLILLALEDGPLRFGALKRTIGDVTQRVLTENLRTLERDGHLSRSVDPGPPVAVSYALTAQGRSLLDVLKPMVLWAGDHAGAVGQARDAYDARQQARDAT